MDANKRRRVGIFVALVIGMALLSPVTSSASDPESPYILAHFPALPDSEVIRALESADVAILNYIGDGTYLVRLPGTIYGESALSRVTDSVCAYPASLKISPELQGVTGTVPLRITLHDGEEADSVIPALLSKGANIIKIHEISAPYILCEMDTSDMQGIAALDQVSMIHPNPEPRTHMSLITSNTYMGVDAAQTGGFTGSGMLAEVQDNGCDTDIIVGNGLGHQDLDIVTFTDGNPVEDDHGTCTTGIVFGSGAGDINAQGIAYQANAAFADWSTGRTTSVTNLWNGVFPVGGNAGKNGIVQSNSWSQGTCNGYYTAYTAEDDAAVVAFPRVLTLWAAANSNDGTAEGMISQDSAAKNVMCIGAIFHKDTAVMTDDQYILQSVGNTPSRGPAADGRQKPDMCGNFDYIYTVDQVGTAGYSSTSYYNNFGGTSGATPEVAGCSVLAYEMYQENFFENNPTNALPYSSTIKALMIADAFQYPLTGTYSATRTCQGWGTPDMEKMYNLGATYHQFDENPQALGSGNTWTREIYADAVNPLKITLCWIDPAAPGTTNTARALRNNLDLKVTSPGGTVYYGNNGLWDSLYSASGTGVNHWSLASSYRDDLNNVENVFIQTPQTGIWTIEVSGRVGDIAQGPQHFSLVSSGARVPISSAGLIDIENDLYSRESTVTITVKDSDLNTNTGSAQTVNVNLRSVAEPAGETTLLTETGPDTSTFVGTKTISATNSAGILYVNAADTLTATYNDANDGTGSPQTVTDTAAVDGTAPSPPPILTVEHFGTGLVPVDATLTTAGTTQAGGPHNVWFAVVDTNAGSELTTPNSAAEFTDAYYTAASTSNDVRAGPGGSTTQGDETFVKCSFATNVDPALATGITFTFEGYWASACTGTMYAWNAVDGAWDQLGTGMAFSTADGTMVRSISADAGDYISGGQILWGVYGDSARQRASVDFLEVVVSYETPFADQDSNTLNWSASPSPDLDHYSIYRADSESGSYSLIGSSPAGVNTYQDTDKGMADSTRWWYRVRAVDTVGNEEANTNSVPEPGATEPPYGIDLAGIAAGSWAFVSFPIGISGDIGTILPDETGGTAWDVAKWYDSSVKTWKSYRRGATTNTFTTINNRMGVWLHLTANGGDQILTTGASGAYPAASVPITLNAGWNMVGYPSATNRAANVALTGTGATMVSVYSATTPYITDYTNLASVTMSHGHAYWIFVPSATTWNVGV